MRRAWSATLIPLVLLAIAPGCGESKPELPGDAAGLKAFAQSARDEAAKAQAEQRPDDAERAGKLAMLASQKAVELKLGKEDWVAIDDLAVEAEELGLLAREEEAYRKDMSDFAARSYRKGRGATFSVLFTGLERAAEQAATQDISKLDPAVQKAAHDAAQMAQRHLGAKTLPDGSPDWPAIAADMRTLRDSPPPHIPLFFAVMYAVNAQPGLALVEMENVDPTKLPADFADGYRFGLAVMLWQRGYPRMARREMEQLLADEPAGSVLVEPQVRALGHLMLAGLASEQSDWERVDLEIARATKAWPENPLMVYLTGEQLNAKGEHEAAAQSLEKSLSGIADPQVAQMIKDRAKEIRDSQGQPKPLFADPVMRRRIAMLMLRQWASESATGEKVEGWLDSATALGARVKDAMPKLEWPSASSQPASSQPATAPAAGG